MLILFFVDKRNFATPQFNVQRFRNRWLNLHCKSPTRTSFNWKLNWINSIKMCLGWAWKTVFRFRKTKGWSRFGWLASRWEVRAVCTSRRRCKSTQTWKHLICAILTRWELICNDKLEQPLSWHSSSSCCSRLQRTDSIIGFATVLRYNSTLKVLNVSRPILTTNQEEASVHMSDMLKVRSHPSPFLFPPKRFTVGIAGEPRSWGAPLHEVRHARLRRDSTHGRSLR